MILPRVDLTTCRYQSTTAARAGSGSGGTQANTAKNEVIGTRRQSTPARALRKRKAPLKAHSSPHIFLNITVLRAAGPPAQIIRASYHAFSVSCAAAILLRCKRGTPYFLSDSGQLPEKGRAPMFSPLIRFFQSWKR